MKTFSWKTWPKPIIALAPMDGWTDSAFRQIIKSTEPKTLVFTEFVSVDGITHHKRSEQLLQKAIFHHKSEKPLIVQLFGKDPDKFALAAKMLEKLGADGIDINFGCPAKKVIHSNNGAALLKEPDLAAKIVKETKKATKLPVSVKTRLGWSDKYQILEFAELMFKNGADALTVHGRTANQKFTGTADYEPIFELKQKFPDKIIIGNGDITSAKQALDIIKKGKLNGIMIGREAMQNPYIFTEIFASLNNKTFKTPSLNDNIKLALKHCKLKEKNKGKNGVLEMRKFFASIIRGVPGAAELRAKLMQTQSYDEIKDMINNNNSISLS